MLSAIEVYIIAMTLQALLTGVYLASFLLCLRWLIFSDDGGALRKTIQWPFLTITIILFAFSATDLGMSLQATFLASQGASITRTILYNGIITMFIEMLTSIITDGVLIFRCWTVYTRSWRITVLPLLLLLYNISSLFVTTYWNAIYDPTGNEPTDIQVENMAVVGSYYAATIAINVYATSAITFLIWRNSLPGRKFARFAIRVIAESGLLYTLTSIASFCMVFPSSPVGYSIASAINFPTAGIAFNLILIRVAQNRASPEPELPTFIGDSTIERAIPAAPRRNSETVASTREGL